jgi:hypothetical protein
MMGSRWIIEGACSSVWLERTPDKREVDGSIPSRPTTTILDFGFLVEKNIKTKKSPIRNKFGGVAQLGERLPCTQEAIGSSPFTSTIEILIFNLEVIYTHSLFVFQNCN